MRKLWESSGDEMNIHAPQTIEAETELRLLSTTDKHIISPQESKPNIAIVQDSLTALYMMTNGIQTMTKAHFFNISMYGDIRGRPLWNPHKIKIISRVLKKMGKQQQIYTGHSLFSLLLPEDFNYEKKNNINIQEPVVKIYRGVLYEGTLDKSIVGASNNSIIQILNKEYGIGVTSDFISNVQFISNKWLLINGFSIGLEDCLIKSERKKNDIQDQISKCYIEAKGIENTTQNPGIREIRVTASLSKAKDIGMRIAKESMKEENNLLKTVLPGSKGDFFNISQLTGLMGQQNIMHKRVMKQLNNGKRSLPHYPFEGLSKEEEYESRGFIHNSLTHGINPKEFFFHSMAGREGIIKTAMSTALSGYMQRRIIKICEDLQIQYDGSVRDISGKTYQFVYGNTGIDPRKTVKVEGKQQACDITRMVSRLNLQYEIVNERKEENKYQKKNRKPSKLSLLGKIYKLSGKKPVYSDWSVEKLSNHLEQLEKNSV